MNVHVTISQADIPASDTGSLAKTYLRAQLFLVLLGTDLLALISACILATVMWQSGVGVHLSGLMLALIALYGLSGFAFRAFAGDALLRPLPSVRGALLSWARRCV